MDYGLPPDPMPADSLLDQSALLREVCQQVSQLSATTARRPHRISVRAGEVSVELEWPGPGGPDPAGLAVADGTAAADPAAGAEPPEDPDLHYIRAATVGTFYHSAEPGARPFVAVGDIVHEGQQIGILEAMKLMMPVEADRAGRVVELLVPDAAPVEYASRLLVLAPLDPAA